MNARKARGRATTVSSSATLTKRSIEKILRGSAQGAKELDAKLKKIFVLSDANASLRLK
jgi:hypothetical protein